MKPSTLLLVFAISSSLHCSSTTSDGGVVPEPPPVVPPGLTKLIPLGVGNSWEYRDLQCGGWGCDTTYNSVSVTDTVVLGGRKHFVMVGEAPHLFSWEGATYLETVDSTSYAVYWCMGCLDGEGEGGQWLPLMVLRTPLSRGHQWRIADWDSAYGFAFGNLEITSVDTTVVVAGRRFERAIAVAQHTGNQFGDLRFVLVPGVGVVSQWGLDTWFRRELVEWNVE